MELNYYRFFIKEIDQNYQSLKMAKDFNWNENALTFFQKYHHVSNLAEVLVLKKYLDSLNIWEIKQFNFYYQQSVLMFNQQKLAIDLSYQLLTKLHQIFKSWTIEYNHDNLLKFNEFIFNEFSTNQEYLNLKFKELFLKNNHVSLINYLTELNQIVSNKKTSGVDLMAKIGEFYFKINDYLAIVKKNQREFTNIEKEFYEFLNQFSLKMKYLMTLYYQWLNLNEIIDVNASKYQGFYH